MAVSEQRETALDTRLADMLDTPAVALMAAVWAEVSAGRRVADWADQKAAWMAELKEKQMVAQKEHPWLVPPVETTVGNLAVSMAEQWVAKMADK